MIMHSVIRKWGIVCFIVCLVTLLIMPVSGAEKITLRYMIVASRDVELRPVVDAFNAQNPNIKIEIQKAPGSWDKLSAKLLVSFAAGTAPDITDVQDKAIPALAVRGLFLNLDRYIKKDNEFKKATKDQVDRSNEPWKMNSKTGQIGVGSQYALSYNGGAVVLYYNKTLFDKAGVAYPTDKWTWNDFQNAARKLTVKDDKGRITQYGYISDTTWYHDFPTLLWSAGGDFLTFKGKVPHSVFNKPQTLAALKLEQNMVVKEKIALPLVTTDDMLNAFGTGRAAMFSYGSWTVSRIKRLMGNYKWSIAAWPPINPKAGLRARKTRSTFDGIGITRNCKYPDQAWKFIKFMTIGEGQQIIAKTGGYQPVMKSVLHSKLWIDPDIPQKADFDTYSSIGKSLPANVMWPQMQTQLQKYYSLMLSGEMTPEETQKKMHLTINNLMIQGKQLLQDLKLGK